MFTAAMRITKNKEEVNTWSKNNDLFYNINIKDLV